MPVRYTLRQLQYFVAVGEAGSIALASERISISPPSISSAISQLEREFGIQLFVRQHAQGLSLTPGGRRVFNEAKRLLEQAASLHELAGDIAERIRGELSVGCLVTVAPFVLPELRKGFEDRHPGTRVRHTEANQAELLRLLRRAEIDAAITYDLELPQDVAFEPLATLPPYALFHSKHELADATTVSLETLSELPLVLLDLPLSREYFLSLFQQRGLRPTIAEKTGHLPMVRSLVANGFGYGLLNVPSMNRHAPDGKALAYVRIEDALNPLSLGVVTVAADQKSRVLAAFEEHCRATITEDSAPGLGRF